MNFLLQFKHATRAGTCHGKRAVAHTGRCGASVTTRPRASETCFEFKPGELGRLSRNSVCCFRGFRSHSLTSAVIHDFSGFAAQWEQLTVKGESRTAVHSLLGPVVPKNSTEKWGISKKSGARRASLKKTYALSTKSAPA